MDKIIIVICGVSGVGKTTIIKELVKKDESIVYIKPYMTRLLRIGEVDKKSISDERMNDLVEQGKVIENRLYANRYGSPIEEFELTLKVGKTPIIDFPIDKVQLIKDRFESTRILCFYIMPPSVEILKNRLRTDGRITETDRLETAINELKAIENQIYGNLITLTVVNGDCQSKGAADKIYDFYKDARVAKAKRRYKI